MRLYLLELGIVAATGTPFPGYLIQTDDDKNVLIDTGSHRSIVGSQERVAAQLLASFPDDASNAINARIIHGMRFDAEDLVVSRLAALGLTPQDIDYLVCTHFDFDHAGNHDLFPGADLVVQRGHYEVARQHPRFRLFDAPWDTPALHYRLVDGDMELLPGIELIESGGHTPGHMSVLVRLPETGAILLAIDAIGNREQLDPQAPDSVGNMDNDAARASVKKLIGIAECEGVELIVFGHDAEQWQTLRKSPEFYM